MFSPITLILAVERKELTRELAVSALGTLAIPALLWVFYAAVRTEWPENYVTASEDFGTVVNRTVGRYLTFMLGPTYVVALIVATTVDRFGGHPLASALTGASIHVLRTQVAHFFRVLLHIRDHTRLPAIIVGLAASVGIFVAATLGSFGPGPFTAVVPPVDEFFKSLWTTILVALIAVIAINVSRKGTGVADLVARSRSEVGEPLLQLARQKAEQHGADPVIVEAILLTENLERPSWIRYLERLKGFFSAKGTYGVMQAYSPKPLTNEASIEIAVAEHLAGVIVERDKYGYLDDSSLKMVLRKYNTNSNFVDLATRIVSEIYDVSSYMAAAHKGEGPFEEQIQERLDLALKVWREMAVRVVAQNEGVVAIARTPLRDLRTLADVVERIPQARNPEEEAMRDRAQARFESSVDIDDDDLGDS